MIAKQPRVPLPDDLKQLRDDAFHTAQNEWDGWNAEPLTESQVFQITYIVNVLIEKAMSEISESVYKADSKQPFVGKPININDSILERLRDSEAFKQALAESLKISRETQ